MTTNCLLSCYQSERKCLYEYMYTFILFIFQAKNVFIWIFTFFFRSPNFVSSAGTVFLVIVLQSLEFSDSAMSNLYPDTAEVIRLWLCHLSPINLLRKVSWFLGNTDRYGSRHRANGSECNTNVTKYIDICVFNSKTQQVKNAWAITAMQQLSAFCNLSTVNNPKCVSER